MSPPPTKRPIKLIRPAVIELRFGDSARYKQQIRIFKRALNPNPREVVTTNSSCYFPISANLGGAAPKQIELRFLLLKPKQPGSTRTVVYWEVPGSRSLHARDSLATTSDSLVRRHGFKVLEPIAAVDGSIQTLLGVDAEMDTAALAGVNSGSGRMMGLVVNPPYPTLIDTAQGIAVDTTGRRMNNSTPKDAANSPGYWLWLGCLLCLALGFLVGRAWKK